MEYEKTSFPRLQVFQTYEMKNCVRYTCTKQTRGRETERALGGGVEGGKRVKRQVKRQIGGL